MRHILFATLLSAALLQSADTLADGVLAGYDNEETERAISYANIRAAIAGVGSTTDYTFTIVSSTASSTSGTSDYLKTAPGAGGADIVAGVTTIGSGLYLYWRPLDDDFTILPGGDTTPDFTAIRVAVIDVYEGATLRGRYTLSAHVMGVLDTISGPTGVYGDATHPVLSTPATPISVAQGGTLTLTYDQIAGMCNWVDKEKNGGMTFDTFLPPLGLADLTIDNRVGSQWPDGTAATTYLGYGGTVTVHIPASTSVGIHQLCVVQALYDPDGFGGSAMSADTNVVALQVDVSVPPPSGSGASGGGGGGGGGCGAGTAGGMIVLPMLLLGLRRRQRR